MLRLEPLMTLTATLGDTLPVGNGGLGVRSVANVSGGHFSGPELNGSVCASGADWVLIGTDGFGRVDVRLVLTTDDGANIYVTYTGLLALNDVVRTALANGGGTDWGETTFLTQLRFETGDARYAWLNHTLGVAEGRLLPGGVEYRVSQLVTGS